MNFNTVKDMASQLDHQDKLKLASLLIQMALSDHQTQAKPSQTAVSGDYQYCLERVLKSRPNRLPALENYLEAILSFKGANTADINGIIKELQLYKAIRLDGETVVYLID